MKKSINMKMVFVLVTLFGLSSTLKLPAWSAAGTSMAPKEQGEEDYRPKSTELPTKLNSKEDFQVKTYPPSKDDTKNNLQETNISANAKETTAPNEHNPAEMKTASSTANHPEEPKVTGNKGAEKIDSEKEPVIEDNKLVDIDEKTVEVKKYNGIIWFVVVFIVLLIVVFAFT